MLNAQDCMNIVWTHAANTRNQAGSRTKFPAVNGLYRDNKGNSCFIGALIESRVYHRGLENLGVSDAIVVRALKASDVDVDRIPMMFFSRLQYIHDNAPAHFWSVHLDKLAKDYNLNIRK